MDVNKYVAERIKYYRIKNNLSQEDVGAELNTSKTNICRYETGERKFDHDILFKLSKIFNVNVNDFFPDMDDAEFMYPDEDTIMINVLGYIKAGLPIEAQEDIIDKIAIPRSWTKGGKEFYALKISGDSMSPRYNDGEIVIFEQTNDYLGGNYKDCAVMVNHTECTFKKVYIKETGVTLHPYNPKYKEMYYTAEEAQKLPIKIIGIAVEKRVPITYEEE